MKRAVIQLLIVLCAAPAQFVFAQQPPTSNQTGQSAARQKREGAITGRVIGPDGQPLAGAEIFARRISERGGSNLSVTSDDDGNFKLTGLSPGAYRLSAYAPGYINAEFPSENDVHRLGGNVTINLIKGGVITGRVTDEAGEPMVGVKVSPQRLRDLEGKAASSRFDNFDGLGWMTDDRGIYRVYGLPPGVYILSVGAGYGYSYDEAQISRDAPTYYPSATRDTAAEISLRGGEEVSGIDIRHRGERGHIVSGVISGDIEWSPPYSHVSVTLRGIEAGLFKVSGTTPNSRGFAMCGVPDGEYELAASRSGGDRDETFSSAPRRISVKGADVGGVELKLAKHGSISGRVVIESSKRCAGSGGEVEGRVADQAQEATGRQPVVEEITLKAERDEPDQSARRPRFGESEFRRNQAPSEKGEFALKSLEAGRYRIAANLPEDGWFVRAVNQPGAGSAKPAAGAAKSSIDAAPSGVTIKPGETLSGVEVIVAEGAASLSGRVVPAKEGMKLPLRLRAHLIPAEATAANDVMRYAEAVVRDDGSFEFKHIAPGKYLLHARQVAEREASDDQVRPAAWDAGERSKLRREAEAAKNEVELQSCQRVKDHVLRLNR